MATKVLFFIAIALVVLNYIQCAAVTQRRESEKPEAGLKEKTLLQTGETNVPAHVAAVEENEEGLSQEDTVLNRQKRGHKHKKHGHVVVVHHVDYVHHYGHGHGHYHHF